MLSCTIPSHQFGGCSMQYKNVIALQCPDARFAASFSLVGCCWPMVNYCMVLLKTLGTIIEMPLFFPLVWLNCFSAWWFEFSMPEGFSWFVQCTEGKTKRPQIAVATPRDLWVWISNKHREVIFELRLELALQYYLSYRISNKKSSLFIVACVQFTWF